MSSNSSTACGLLIRSWSKDSVESHAVFGAKPKKPITAAHPLYSRSECAPRRQSPGGRQFGAAGQGIATPPDARPAPVQRSEEHTSELQSLMRIAYAVFCLKKKKR